MTLWKLFDLRQYALDFRILLIGITLIGVVFLAQWIYQSNCDLAVQMGFGNAMNKMGLCYP